MRRARSSRRSQSGLAVRLQNVPIRSRLFISFLIVVALTGAIGVIAVRESQALATEATDLNARDLPEVVTLGQIQVSLLQEHLLNQELTDAHYDGTPQATALIAQLAAQTVTLQHSDSVTSASGPRNDTHVVTALLTELTSLRALLGQMTTLQHDTQFAQALAIARDQADPLVRQALANVVILNASEQFEAFQTSQQVQRESMTEGWLIAGLMALIALLAASFALLVARSLTGPLARLLQATETMAQGDLSVPLEERREDEIGRLAQAFDRMRQHLRATITDLGLAQQRTQAIIDTAADGMLVLDDQLRVLQLNPATTRISGWRQAEALGRPWHVVLGCADDLPVQGAAPITNAARLRDGRRPWLRLSVATIAGAGEQHVLSVQDVTRLVAVEQMQTDFVAMVSHELRSPLTNVSGAADLLGQIDPAKDVEAYHELLHILTHQTARLRRVVEQVLQLTRFEAGRFQVQASLVCLGEYTRELVAQVRGEWVGSGFALALAESGDDVRARADLDLLEIILRNLLDNARKYATAHTAITVTIRAVGGQAQCLVANVGPTIAPDDQDHIFERFVRGQHATAQAAHGYGLGLFIARELARAQGGDVWLDHEAVGGACFVVALPGVGQPAMIPEAR